MGYWGTVVVGRARSGLLVHQDAVERFGNQHYRLRTLHDGWQLLETNTWQSPPPDLTEAGAALARSTGAPVLGQVVGDAAR